jgi:alanine racemase
MMAMDSGTISYEIMTSLGQRPHRNYIGNLHQAS